MANGITAINTNIYFFEQIFMFYMFSFSFVESMVSRPPSRGRSNHLQIQHLSANIEIPV